MLKFLKKIQIRSFETGLLFVHGEFDRLLDAGRHWLFDPLRKKSVEIVSRRAPWIVHDQLDVIVKSGALEGRADWIDLKDHQRALVWIDGRFDRFLSPGLHAWWTDLKDVQVEVIDAR
ncbi:MAG TPA: slipin family protein, partial [Planctomycetaceae bacterium]|nr:slipin family protein [Planctomycetaceae bacterium]